MSSDFPKALFDAVPGWNGEWPQPNWNPEIANVYAALAHTPPLVRDYMFNPVLLDYPVIGVTKIQASKFCKWLSDRYNELSLNIRGKCELDSFYLNENNFVTEAYLFGQFICQKPLGSWDSVFAWEDGVFVPTFRLPTSPELNQAQPIGLSDELKPYPFAESHFLNFWNSLYLEVNDSSVELKTWFANHILRPTQSAVDLSVLAQGEMALGGNGNEDLLRVLAQNGQPPYVVPERFDIPEKDSMGHLEFVIIG